MLSKCSLKFYTYYPYRNYSFFLQLMNIIYLIVTCVSDKCVKHKILFHEADIEFVDINL